MPSCTVTVTVAPLLRRRCAAGSGVPEPVSHVTSESSSEARQRHRAEAEAWPPGPGRGVPGGSRRHGCAREGLL